MLWLKIKRKIRYMISGMLNPINCLRLSLNNVNYGKNCVIHGAVWINNQGIVELGNDVKINSAPWANPIGGGYRTYLQVFTGGKLTIGSHTGMSNTAITCAGSINIGSHVLLGSGCKIYDTDFHPLEAKYRYGQERDSEYTRVKGIVIEDGAFIGADSIILKGTHVGKNSIIGAGSVVSGLIPDNEIWAGNPARFIKKVNEE